MLKKIAMGGGLISFGALCSITIILVFKQALGVSKNKNNTINRLIAGAILSGILSITCLVIALGSMAKSTVEKKKVQEAKSPEIEVNQKKELQDTDNQTNQKANDEIQSILTSNLSSKTVSDQKSLKRCKSSPNLSEKNSINSSSRVRPCQNSTSLSPQLPSKPISFGNIGSNQPDFIPKTTKRNDDETEFISAISYSDYSINSPIDNLLCSPSNKFSTEQGSHLQEEFDKIKSTSSTFNETGGLNKTAFNTTNNNFFDQEGNSDSGINSDYSDQETTFLSEEHRKLKRKNEEIQNLEEERRLEKELVDIRTQLDQVKGELQTKTDELNSTKRELKKKLSNKTEELKTVEEKYQAHMEKKNEEHNNSMSKLKSEMQNLEEERRLEKELVVDIRTQLDQVKGELQTKTDELNSTKRELKKKLNNKTEELKTVEEEYQAHMEKKNEEHNNSMSKLKSEMQNLEEENKTLKEKNTNLKDELKEWKNGERILENKEQKIRQLKEELSKKDEEIKELKKEAKQKAEELQNLERLKNELGSIIILRSLPLEIPKTELTNGTVVVQEALLKNQHNNFPGKISF
ncbi:MAG: hypothetical protein HRK26_00650 [Rickettsiaceae bacterium H1]|nr:hypothetical protein [Rickettsiaceae bacterium H1]